MGYKTSNPKEVMELQKAGKLVVGIMQPKRYVEVNGKKIEHMDGELVYEFNFDIDQEEKKTNDDIAVEPQVREEEEKVADYVADYEIPSKVAIEEKEQEKQKKRGRPRKK